MNGSYRFYIGFVGERYSENGTKSINTFPIFNASFLVSGVLYFGKIIGFCLWLLYLAAKYIIHGIIGLSIILGATGMFLLENLEGWWRN